ncbi:MAG: DNA/RNA non-specific endonuclease [Reyranella sp.]
MKAPPRIATGARDRIEGSMKQIQASLNAIGDGRPGDAETDPTRRSQVYQARTGVSLSEAKTMAARPGEGRERIFGKTVDFVDVAFFDRGRRAARAVARIITRDGAALGTGFLISPRLLMTNNHVIGDERAANGLWAEFDYELDLDGRPAKVTRFAFAPQLCFLTNHEDNLDYTVVALGDRVMGSKALSEFGYLPVSSARNKHQLGDLVNIIQHPDGRMKEAVVRENQIVARKDTTLHYVADTEPGSSGSPVLNVQFGLVALHHWGSPHRDLTDDKGKLLPKTINEGIRASSIYTDLTTLSATLKTGGRSLIAEALQIGLKGGPVPYGSGSGAAGDEGAGSHNGSVPTAISDDGSATWNIPLTVTVRVGNTAAIRGSNAAVLPVVSDAGSGGAGSEAKLELDPDYDGRDGYDSTFLGGTQIPLPKLSTNLRKIAARNLHAKPGEDPFELKYHHYSVVMNGKRRLAFVSAVNIDGAQAKDFNRQKGTISDPFEDGGQEASEQWFADERIKPNQQTPPDFYQGQTTFDTQGKRTTNKRSTAHLYNLFQQGHLTRRQDPIWGDDDELIKFSNADTFHVTNCAPQIGFFNMGMARKESLAFDEKATPKKTKSKQGKTSSHPGGILHWRALEEYVQTNARADRGKVTVFTGPIFNDGKDYAWDRGRADMKGFKAPREYWKLILRKEKGDLQATALLANQSPLIGSRLPEKLDPRVTYGAVDQYHLSIAELESRTKLDFGSTVREADTYVPKGTGESRRIRKVTDVADVNLNRPAKRRR